MSATSGRSTVSVRPPQLGVMSVGTALRLAGALVPLVGYATVDNLRRRPVRADAAVPGLAENITVDWLNRVLRRSLGGAKVQSFEVEEHSSGTSVRARIRLYYNGMSLDEQPPATIFVKSAPTVLTRVSNGLSGTAPAEAGFFNELRDHFNIEAPRGYYSAVESHSFRSIQILEDLVATRAADFCQPTTEISRKQADQIVEQLAVLHGTASRLGLRGRRRAWLRTYPEWWQATGSMANTRRYHLRGQRRADEAGITPSRLVGRGEQLWRSFEASVDAHRKLPGTLIHGDSHLGNWYITGTGQMGLCDWQCISVGHWSRDLSYALSSTLSVEQRRAWEDSLIDTYLEHLADQGGEVVSPSRAMELYRQQLTGALMMWTTTLYPPKFLPDMQPATTSVEMLRRILTAIDDHDALAG